MTVFMLLMRVCGCFLTASVGQQIETAKARGIAEAEAAIQDERRRGLEKEQHYMDEYVHLGLCIGCT